MHKIYDIEAVPPRLTIGRQGESDVELIRFDCSAWLEMYGNMELSVWVTRHGENAAYPAVTTRDGNIVVWNVSAVDTAISGEGSIEVLGIVDNKRKLSARAITHVLPSGLANTKDTPNGGELWAADVLNAAERVEVAVAHPPIIGENGNWWLWDFEKSEYADSGKPSAGAGGSASVKEVFVVTITRNAQYRLVADKTIDEIVAAAGNGMICVCRNASNGMSTAEYNLHSYNGYSAVFTRISAVYDDMMYVDQLTVTSNGNVAVVSGTIGGNGGGESGGGSLVVTVTYDGDVGGLVADKTKEEIIEALNNGIPCMAIRDEGSVKTILHPYRVEDYFVGFSTTSYIYDEYMTIEKLDFNEYDEIISSSYDIPFGGGGGGWE
jgi:hypothetical protein